MSIIDADIVFVLDLFAPLGKLSHRKMMGGLSIYLDGTIFAMVNRSGQIFLKAKGDFAKILAAEGSTQFGADHGRLMPYWTLPDAALDDSKAASDWAKQALAAL